jgi:glyoxylase-like metal-dependent hydrolase (beta-lactamase superfamily II)
MKVAHMFFLLVVLGLISSSDLLPQDFGKVEIKATKLGEHVYMLVGTYGNMAVSLGTDGVLLVDDDLAPVSEKIKVAIRELGGDLPKFILNTHWHLDHTDGNKIFGAEGATIIAHSNVRKRLSTQQEFGGQLIDPMPKDAWPLITFDLSLSIHFNGEEIEVIHYPHGHTDGDAIIYFTGSNVVDLGDLFFAGFFPNVDLVSGGNVESYITNIGQVLDTLPEDVTIIPGHGPLSTKDDLRRYHEMVKETTQIVRKRIEAGKNLEEIKAEGLPDEWKSLNTPQVTTERWLETVYDSLTGRGMK